MFYTRPIGLAISAHFLLPHEVLTKVCTLGRATTMLGLIWVFFDPSSGLATSIMGDLFAITAAYYAPVLLYVCG